MAESEGGCAHCGHLQAQVSQLQAQVRHLEQENQQLRQRIERLREVIQFARATCRQYMQQLGEVLAHRSGIPPGRWAYCKGGYTVAYRIWAVLAQGEG